MILGIGTDLANIDRIQKTIDRFGQRFKDRVFTPIEQNKAEKRKDIAGTYAKRWAAKEACSKALGTGLAMGISWKDIRVKKLPSGKPILLVKGGAKNYLDKIKPHDSEAVLHLTISDDIPWVSATVIIEARRSLPK